jgi:hypothetical protein
MILSTAIRHEIITHMLRADSTGPTGMAMEMNMDMGMHKGTG